MVSLKNDYVNSRMQDKINNWSIVNEAEKCNDI